MRPDEALARRAQQDRAAERVKQAETAQQGQVVVQRLAKADAGIDDDARRGRCPPHCGLQTGRPGSRRRPAARRRSAGRCCIVFGIALGMHQADRHAGLGGERAPCAGSWVSADTSLTICAPASQRGARDRRLAGVDRDRRVRLCPTAPRSPGRCGRFRRPRGPDRPRAGWIRRRYRGYPRPAPTSACAWAQGGIGGVEPPAVRKTVRRDVEYAHEARRIQRQYRRSPGAAAVRACRISAGNLGQRRQRRGVPARVSRSAWVNQRQPPASVSACAGRAASWLGMGR